MKKWEYRVKICNCDSLSVLGLLDRMSKEGWEVCSHCWEEDCYSFIFKREKEDA